MSTKSRIYKFLRLWNDASAVKKGKVGREDDWASVAKTVQVVGFSGFGFVPKRADLAFTSTNIG